MKLLTTLLACPLFALAACGGDGTTTVVKTVTTGASEGTSTGYANPSQSTITQNVPTETNAPTETEPASTDCDDLGINPESRNEGACVDSDGARVKVVNKDTKLTLPELDAEYLGYRTGKSIESDFETQTASGVFVIVKLRITNKTGAPVEVDPEGISLSVSPNNVTKLYTHIFDAENTPGDSFIWQDKVQPDASMTGTVVYDMPQKRVADIEKTGNINILQFSDVNSFEEPTKTIGTIRTYE
jgi:hypothetical protein